MGGTLPINLKNLAVICAYSLTSINMHILGCVNLTIWFLKMTEKAIEKLDEQLNCSICLDTYTDPKLLQCFHTYCTKCLLPLVRDTQGQLTLTCPACRQVTPIPPNGVRGLQSAFQINEFIEIRDDLKKAKDPLPSQEPEVDDESISQVPSIKTTRYCFEHADRELGLYCETCNELICLKCVLKGGKHHDHNSDPLDEVFDKYKGEIASSLEPMEKQLKTIHTALAQLNTRSREISDQRGTIEASIYNTIRRLHEILDVRKIELIGQLHKMIQRKLKTLASQKKQMETIQAQLSSCIHFVNETLKTSSQGGIMKTKTTIVNQVKELTTPFQPDLFKPNTEADIIFSPLPDITAECHMYGIVYSSRSPYPLRCQATGKSLEVAVVGKKCTVIVKAVNYNGAPCEEDIQSLQCELVSELTHATVKGSLKRRGQSQYEISYQPTIKGRHQLHIKVEDQHIKGSPCPVAVKLPIKKLGTPILTIGGLKGPWGITFNQRGEVVVTEWRKHCVSIFSPSGQKLRSFGTRGFGYGQFNLPRGVTVDGEGNILVADRNNYRIQKFTPEGKFLKSVGSEGKGPLQFIYPRAITFNPTSNKVYVVDDNHCVTILNSDLTFSSWFQNQDTQFNQLYDIACDSTGNVYVADFSNHRIQVFTAEGKFLRMFGRRGHGRGELFCPISITLDTSDRVYVGDSNHRLSLFTSDGHFISSFGRLGSGPGEFNFPGGLAVDASGVVYVCDTINHQIQLF